MAKKKTTSKKTSTKTIKSQTHPAAETTTRPAKDAEPAKVSKPTADKPKRTSGLDHVVKILTESKEPLSAKTIAELAIAAGWKTEGATPHATLYSAMIREIKNKGDESRFVKVERGRFTIRK